MKLELFFYSGFTYLLCRRVGRDGLSDNHATGTYFTFGHTKGATSWTTDVSENGKKHKTVFTSSVTTLDYPLVNNLKYPHIAEDFTKTFQTLKSIKADVFLSSHGGFFDLTEKAEKLRSGAKPNPFIDPKGYQRFVKRMRKAFENKRAEENKK